MKNGESKHAQTPSNARIGNIVATSHILSSPTKKYSLERGRNWKIRELDAAEEFL